MRTKTILLIGAGGQIGVELVMALRERYGAEQVIASDLRTENRLTQGTGPFVQFNVMEKDRLRELVRTRLANIWTFWERFCSMLLNNDCSHALRTPMSSVTVETAITRKKKTNNLKNIRRVTVGPRNGIPRRALFSSSADSQGRAQSSRECDEHKRRPNAV